MQIILEKIQDGTWNRQQLLEALVAYHDKSVDEYDLACDQIDIRDEEINQLTLMTTDLKKVLGLSEENRMLAVGAAKELQAQNIIVDGQLQDYKATQDVNKTQYKKIGALSKSNATLITRNDKLVKDNRLARQEVSEAASDLARMRMTGHKSIGNYSFHLFPSKVKNEADGGKIEERVHLVAMTKNGCMKLIGCENEQILQPNSHTFKFNEEQTKFIRAFDFIAQQDGWQFSDRLLRMIN